MSEDFENSDNSKIRWRKTKAVEVRNNLNARLPPKSPLQNPNTEDEDKLQCFRITN